MENFKVINRYGQFHEFVHLEGEIYTLKALYDMYRILYEEGDDTMSHIYAIDPDGGPFMTKGYVFENGMKIEDIHYNDNKEIIFIIK